MEISWRQNSKSVIWMVIMRFQEISISVLPHGPFPQKNSMISFGEKDIETSITLPIISHNTKEIYFSSVS